ncbi:MAG: 30S ribosomal protein S21 [Patescibacteria group bacterium]
MSVEVKRKKGESFESLLRRFSRRTQQSGRMLEARKRRFFKAEENKTKKRESTIRKLVMGKKREYLIKVGQLIEDSKSFRKKR